MTYSQQFDLTKPNGLENANTIDDIIRGVKTALNERFIDILGVTLSSATDPQRVTKIIIPATGMTIRNSSDSASRLEVSDTEVTLGTTTLTGTMSGGTVAPTTLTVPSGTTIPTHTETGTITATGSTRNGGTLSGATLNNTTFTGTISGLVLDPTIYTDAPSSNVTSITSFTNIASVSVPAGTYLVHASLSYTTGISNNSFGGIDARITNSVNATVSRTTDTFFADNVSFLNQDMHLTFFAVLTIASAGSITLQADNIGASSLTVYGTSNTPNNATRLVAMRVA